MTPVRRPPSPRRQVVNRLNRANGQLAAVVRAIESDAPCKDVIQQLAAVSSAVQRAGFLIIATGLRESLDPEKSDGPTEDPEQFEKLFLMLA